MAYGEGSKTIVIRSVDKLDAGDTVLVLVDNHLTTGKWLITCNGLYFNVNARFWLRNCAKG